MTLSSYRNGLGSILNSGCVTAVDPQNRANRASSAFCILLRSLLDSMNYFNLIIQIPIKFLSLGREEHFDCSFWIFFWLQFLDLLLQATWQLFTIAKLLVTVVAGGREIRTRWLTWQIFVFQIGELLHCHPVNMKLSIVIKQNWTPSIKHCLFF